MTNTPDAEILTLSLRTARERVGVSQATFGRWVASGALPVIRIHGRVLVDPYDLKAFLEAHKQVGPRKSPTRDEAPAPTEASVGEDADDARDSLQE